MPLTVAYILSFYYPTKRDKYVSFLFTKETDDGQMMVQKSNTENAYCASLESIKIYFI